MTAGPTTAHDQLTAADPHLWPDVAQVPHSPVRAAIARQLWHRALPRLAVRVTEGDSRAYGGGGPDAPTMRLIRPDAFFARLGGTGTIGFGEAYMAGDWASDDPAGVLTAFASNMRDLVPQSFHRLRHAVLSRQPTHEDNTISGARNNISRHYDLSNDLFKLFLDDSLTYSSALFDGDPADSEEALNAAQGRKIERLLDIAHVGPGRRVLEIGTGWGELSIRRSAAWGPGHLHHHLD